MAVDLACVPRGEDRPHRWAGPPAGRWLDVVGMALVATLAGWVATYAGSGARPAPVLALLGASVVAGVAGRVSVRWSPALAPSVLAVGAAGALLVWLPVLHRTNGSPLGYANANAALLALGCLAAVGALLHTGSVRPLQHRLGRPAVALPLLLAVATLVPGSTGGVAVLAVGAGLVGMSVLSGRARPAVLVGAAVVVATLAFTVVVALGADPLGMGERTGARGDLWHAAVELTGEHPLRGLGPGEFAPNNPVSWDPDLRWVHNGYLQAGAEVGVPGLASGLALLAWAYGRLWVAAASARVERVGVGVAAVTALALHATVDYVLHFPVLVLTVAALLGWATARSSPEPAGEDHTAG